MQKTKTAQEVKILLLGETGSGKSTLINMLTNVNCGRAYEDERLFAIPCDLKLVNPQDEHQINRSYRVECNIEEFKKFNSEDSGGDSKSKTNFVTFYRFKDKNSGKVTTLIDSPGLGDTRGPAYDDNHIEAITQAVMFANGINLICIVQNSTEARLKNTMEKAINRLKEMFTNESMKIFTVCLTNSPRSSAPNCMDSLKQLCIPTGNIFRFENGCLVHPNFYKKEFEGKPEVLEDEVKETIEDNQRQWKHNDKSAKKLFEFADQQQPLYVEILPEVIRKQT